MSQGFATLANMSTTLKSEDDIRNDDTRIAGLVEELATLASNLFAGEARFVALIGEFDRLGGWADGTTRSCAHWLNWRLGIAMPAARERVRVARRLDGLPAIAAAFEQGRLSYSKVRALTRVATQATEDTLLGFALFSTAAQLERICSTWRLVQAQSEPDAADAQRAVQDLSLMMDDDGSLLIQGRLPTDVGVLFAQALAAAAETLWRGGGPADPAQTAEPARTGESEQTAGSRRVDALRVVAESFLASGPTGSSSADHWQIVVHADADELAAAGDGQPAQPEVHDNSYDDGCNTLVPTMDVDPYSRPPLAHVEGGPTMPNPVLLRLACDATLQVIAEGPDGTAVGIGRRSRDIPGWLRRLLYERDPSCQFPGCGNWRWTDGHHIIHWTKGGPTDLNNLIRLCRAHHTIVHNQNLAIATSIDKRTWTFHRHDGSPIQPTPGLPGGSPDGLPDGGQVSQWEGDPARLSLIIDGLLQAQTKYDDSAETSASPLDGSEGRPIPGHCCRTGLGRSTGRFPIFHQRIQQGGDAPLDPPRPNQTKNS